MSALSTLNETNAVIKELETLDAFIHKRLSELKSINRATGAMKDADLAARLDALPWRLAQSKKCKYLKAEEIPPELFILIDPKSGAKSEKFHYSKSKDETAAFQFERKKEGAKP